MFSLGFLANENGDICRVDSLQQSVDDCFSEMAGDEECRTYQVPGEGVEAFFCFTEVSGHQPNENRIAFWAESRAEVDRLAKVVRQAGGLNLEGPELCRDYSPGYYAAFFEDPSGNKLEICFRESRPS